MNCTANNISLAATTLLASVGWMLFIVTANRLKSFQDYAEPPTNRAADPLPLCIYCGDPLKPIVADHSGKDTFGRVVDTSNATHFCRCGFNDYEIKLYTIRTFKEPIREL